MIRVLLADDHALFRTGLLGYCNALMAQRAMYSRNEILRRCRDRWGR